MATIDDASVVAELVDDAARLLDWCGGSEAFLEDDNEQIVLVVPAELRDSYARALGQLFAVHVQLAMVTLSGQNLQFPMSAVLAELEQAGWDGPLRDFKLQVLEQSGRSVVREVTHGTRGRGGRLRRRVFRAFTGALNAALDSLDGIPGIGPIKEVKDFVEKLAGG